MEFDAVVRARRSIRKFSDAPVPEAVMREAFAHAILAPNSSNAQTWNFYWVRSQVSKEKMIPICLNQSAARTAQEFVVITANPGDIARSQPALVKWVHEVNAPRSVKIYYERLVKLAYRTGPLGLTGLLKAVSFFVTGCFRPIVRGPVTLGGAQGVAIKSAALACENFVLSITNSGYATCMMEGFDEWRLKRLLKLRWTDRVAMVIAVGKEGERGTWGPQMRLPLSDVLVEV